MTDKAIFTRQSAERIARTVIEHEAGPIDLAPHRRRSHQGRGGEDGGGEGPVVAGDYSGPWAATMDSSLTTMTIGPGWWYFLGAFLDSYAGGDTFTFSGTDRNFIMYELEYDQSTGTVNTQFTQEVRPVSPPHFPAMWRTGADEKWICHVVIAIADPGPGGVLSYWQQWQYGNIVVPMLQGLDWEQWRTYDRDEYNATVPDWLRFHD